jgi:hypothetical protein
VGNKLPHHQPLKISRSHLHFHPYPQFHCNHLTPSRVRICQERVLPLSGAPPNAVALSP